MSGNFSDFINEDCVGVSPTQWSHFQEEHESWSNGSMHSFDGDNEPSSLDTSRDTSPQDPWRSPPMRLDSPPAGFAAKLCEPRLSEVYRFMMGDLCSGAEEDSTVEYPIQSYPALPILSPLSDYAVCGTPTSAAVPLPSAYFNSPPMTATTAGVEVAMPRPSRNYGHKLVVNFSTGTPSAASASPAPEMHVGAVVHHVGSANETPAIASAGVASSAAAVEPSPAAVAPVPPVAGPSTANTTRKRRAESAGSSDSSLSSNGRKKPRKVYADALAAASTGPPGTKLWPKRLTTPYQAFLDQHVLPVLKRISEPTKWLVVGGQRSPAFGKLLWERLDEDVKRAWFDKMNAMREEWNATAPENAKCPVQPKPKPETLPKIGKAYREVLGHIEPLVIAFFNGVESMEDMMPGGQPFIDQEAMERAAQGKADVLGFGDDAKGGPLKDGVKPPGTIVMGPAGAAPVTAGSKPTGKAAGKGENSQPARPVRPLPRSHISGSSRQALCQQLVPVEGPVRRSFRCGFVAVGDADRNVA